MKTYYMTVTPADLSLYGRKHTRISSRRPSEGDPAKSTYLNSGDRVYTIRAENIEAARNAEKTAWERKESLEL